MDDMESFYLHLEKFSFVSVEKKSLNAKMQLAEFTCMNKIS